jgi:fumarate hydratase class II
MVDKRYRLEIDSLGEVKIPVDAYWGAQTQRAVENFPISGCGLPFRIIHTLGMIKMLAAQTNLELQLLEPQLAELIIRAAEEVMEGKWDDQFVVDIFQTGSGTSTNMNANEVIANRANQLLGRKKGVKKPVHPNDHVNKGQSSNDVFPTCIHISALESIEQELLPALIELRLSLALKSKEFKNIIKIGRTHLQDATPIQLGQEFSGYAAMVQKAIRRIKNLRHSLSELAIGGTAVGTGINTHQEFASRMIKKINQQTSLSFREAQNHFEAQGSKDALVETSGALKILAVGLIKIANDIRWMGSGPNGGIGELILPEVQPGSSIMPGKVNPVIPEAVCMVCTQVIGYDAAITFGGLSGNFELNTMMPLMAHNLLESIKLLTNVSTIFSKKCIYNLKANTKRIKEILDHSISLATPLSRIIGYDKAAAIAKKAYQSGKTVKELAIEEKILPAKELEKLLNPVSMVSPEK